jgi:hypothetical protein
MGIQKNLKGNKILITITITITNVYLKLKQIVISTS